MCTDRHCGADHVRGRRRVAVTDPEPLRKACRILPINCTRETGLLTLCPGRQRGTRSETAARSARSIAATAPNPAGSSHQTGNGVLRTRSFPLPSEAAWSHRTHLRCSARVRTLAGAALPVGRLAASSSSRKSLNALEHTRGHACQALLNTGDFHLIDTFAVGPGTGVYYLG